MKDQVLKIIDEEYSKWWRDSKARYPSIFPSQFVTHNVLMSIKKRLQEELNSNGNNEGSEIFNHTVEQGSGKEVERPVVSEVQGQVHPDAIKPGDVSVLQTRQT